MSGEKKLWRLPTPFRRFSGKQDLLVKAKAEHSRSRRVSSVYLSDDSSTDGFIVLPEFDDSVQTQTEHEEPSPKPPASFSPLSPNGVDGYPEPIGSQDSSYSPGGSRDTVGVNTSLDDDLTQRLGSAYKHIRSMPGIASSRVSLSSDPQMLRKQLGVPQHSVINHPIRSPPDLPNPHTPPREPTSPRPPPTTPPDVSNAITSNKSGLRIDTNVHPPFPRHPLPDPLQLSQKSALTVPILTETPPTQCTTPWSPTVDSASNPRHSIPKSSKLVKRRVEKPIVSPYPLPSSCRHASGSVLREQAADTPPSTDAHEWQNSLPEIRPPSPFRVDIPLHHTWHDRRTKFHSSTEGHSKPPQFHGAKSRRTSGSTEILASLAWIGTSPTASSPYATNRTHRSASSTFFPEHFSVAIAVEDDSVSDDVLVDHLEKVRRIGDPFERGGDSSSSRCWGNTHFHSVGENENGPLNTSSSPPIPGQFATTRDVLLPSSPTSNDTDSDSEDASVWRSARKALLCIREIVRTERKYQDALKMLLSAQTVTPPPPPMIPYVSALVRASEVLLKYFLEDPSAWGVSTAFVASEDELETAMVSWCAAAGAFFTDGDNPQPCGLTGKWRFRKPGMMSISPSPMTKETSTSLSPQLPPVFSMSNTASKIKERIVEGQYLQADQKRQTASVPLRKPESSSSKARAGEPPSRKLSVRDLAIQPIQRVMRYVLLYRDLLECTPPTSPSRLLVERALEAAMRIANHCDRAQKNPAFCHVF